MSERPGWYDAMPFVGGKRFACDCGCTVFSVRDVEPSVFYCNACPNRYEATPART